METNFGCIVQFIFFGISGIVILFLYGVICWSIIRSLRDSYKLRKEDRLKEDRLKEDRLEEDRLEKTFINEIMDDIIFESKCTEEKELALEIKKIQFEVRNPPLYSLGQEILLAKGIKLTILEERIHVEEKTGGMERRLDISIDNFHILPKYMNRYQKSEANRDKLGIEIAEKELRYFIKKIEKEA